MNLWKDFDPDHPTPIDFSEKKPQHIYKWSTLVNQFAPNKFKRGRFFDSINQEKGNVDNKGDLDNQFDNFNRKFSMFDKKNVNEQVNVENEELKVVKDSLYMKFSKDKNKGNIPKNTMAKTKGF